MKHQPPARVNAEAVLAAVHSVGVECTEAQAQAIADHSNRVIETNQTMNLTRVTSPEGVLGLHVADSATVVALMLDMAPGDVLDMGSGAGYPGIVVQILLGWRTTLVESIKKKAAFLAQTVEEMGLPVQVLAERAEGLPVVSDARYDYVTARALSSLPSLVELAAPLLRRDGRLIAMKGAIEPEEISRGLQAGALCGLSLELEHRFQLPGGEQRAIIVFRKSGKSKIQLPRRSGMAQRNPLA